MAATVKILSVLSRNLLSNETHRQIMWGSVPTSVNTEGYECTSSALESTGSVCKENDFLKGKGCGRGVDPKGRGRGVKESREKGEEREIQIQ